MFDSTIHPGTLLRQFRKSDFASDLWSLKPDDKDEVVSAAKRLAERGFNAVSLKRSTIGTKNVFRQASLPEALLVRHVSEAIRRITSVRQSDRNSIVRSLVQLCAEGIPFNIVKMDIKSFYESVVVDDIVMSLKADAAFSRQSISVLESFFAALGRQQIHGLPRGIGLSATLAEYVMRNFDRKISNYPGVRYYSRYVDDGIAITSADTDPKSLLEFAKKLLPSGLEFNRNKTIPYILKTFSKASAGKIEKTIGFLGYEIDIHEICSEHSRFSRNVRVDIAKSKVSRVKRRLAKSFLEFNDGGDFDDLLDRVKLITSNYGYLDQGSGLQRYAGLRYNYGLIDLSKSQSVKSLDRFLVNTITSQHPNNRIRPRVSRAQRDKLLGLGFETGFVENRFFAFEADRLTNLIKCWAHA